MARAILAAGPRKVHSWEDWHGDGRQIGRPSAAHGKAEDQRLCGTAALGPASANIVLGALPPVGRLETESSSTTHPKEYQVEAIIGQS